MRLLSSVLIAVIITVSGSSASAALVHSIDFSDGTMWDVDVTLFGSATDPGAGIIGGGGGLRADKASGTGAVLVEATLIGTIDTTGFYSLELNFTNLLSSAHEYDATFGVTGDGFDITSTQGISFDETDASGDAGFAGDLETGGGFNWNSTNAATYGQDLDFIAAASNSSITNLVIRLQVNANPEVIDLTGFSIQGTPEPSSMALMGVGLLGAFGTRRRRKKDAAA